MPILIYCFICLWLPNLLLCITEGYTPTENVANLVCSAAIFIFILWLGRRHPRRTVWLCFPLLFLAAFQCVLLGLFGTGAIQEDMFLNLVTTNPSEASEVLSGLGWKTLVVVVIYGGLFVLSFSKRMCRITPADRRMPMAAMVGLLGVTIAIPLAGAAPSRPSAYLFPLTAIDNAWKAVVAHYRIRHYSETSKGYSFGARSTRPDSVPELYIVVVGETSRAASWQLLGYGRPTNPRLVRRDDLLVFGDAHTESNTTHRSVPMLLSNVSSAHYSDSIYKVKSLITAFKEAGFSTAAISAQRPNRSYIEFFLNEADTTVWLDPDSAGRITDMELLAPVGRQIASRARKQLIVVHTYGSHFDYRDRYPASMSYFKPDGPYRARQSEREQIVNAYDNSLRLTDLVLDSIMTLAGQTGVESAVLYTSDHGEDLYDDDKGMFMHAGPVISDYQMHVPLVVWTSEAYRQGHPGIVDILRRSTGTQLSTSATFTPLVLGVAGIKPTDREEW